MPSLQKEYREDEEQDAFIIVCNGTCTHKNRLFGSWLGWRLTEWLLDIILCLNEVNYGRIWVLVKIKVLVCQSVLCSVVYMTSSCRVCGMTFYFQDSCWIGSWMQEIKPNAVIWCFIKMLKSVYCCRFSWLLFSNIYIHWHKILIFIAQIFFFLIFPFPSSQYSIVTY